jgi:epoxyqueuosine reductase
MKDTFLRRALELGFDACGVTTGDPPQTSPAFQEWLRRGCHAEMDYLARNAQKRADPSFVLPGIRSVICLSVSYAGANDEHGSKGSLHRNSNSGLIARYARFRDYHHVLKGRLQSLVDLLHQLEPGARSLWYVDTGPILERDLAQRAGVGFVGKHTGLISRSHGNWILLCEILTTVALEPDEPERNRCGNCTRCLEVCPTRAFDGPFRLDARKCISYLTIEHKGSIPLEMRPAIGNRIFGCDDCLAVCPWNRFAREGRLMREHAREDLSTAALLDLLRLDEAGFKTRFDGTPLVRSKRSGLLRNVCVALGNVGDAEALPALETAAQDPDPLIAEHAAWALEESRARAAAPPHGEDGHPK